LTALPVRISKNRLIVFLAVVLFIAILVLSEYAFVEQTSAQTSQGDCGGDWTSFICGDYSNSRYQPGSTLTSANVGSLRLAWNFTAHHSVTSTPVVANGHVYFADWAGNVYSLNINDGSLNWKTNVGFAVSSTPAVPGNDLVYVAGSPLLPTEVVALNQNTGAISWSKTLPCLPVSHYCGIYSSPTYYNGMIYIGLSDCHQSLGTYCSETGNSNVGQVYALNANNGDTIWNFTTGEYGPNGAYGGGVWGSVVMDPTLNSVYFGTGNAYLQTSCGENCDNYTYSIISLNALSGHLNWNYTVYKSKSADTVLKGDDDFGSTPNLFSITENGVVHQAIGLLIKSGTYYILDRTSGVLLYQFNLKSTSANVGVPGFIYPSGTVNPEIFLPGGNPGYVEAFEPSSSLSPLWVYPTLGNLQASDMALIPGAVLVGDNNGSLYALSMADGHLIFSQPLKLPGIQSGYGIWGGISVAEGYVLVGDYQQTQKESPVTNSGGIFAFCVPSVTCSTGTTTVSTSSSSPSMSSTATTSTPAQSITTVTTSTSTTSFLTGLQIKELY
jgi:polyvinyl alcohol dehydrogenase (cytochrome)